ncbi:hypothetical protein Xoosp14_242 [Xanthomonas phage Xoo-sp14]|nr:hypothetical protein Xoosp14_242 [Xanthomonas phage Xoo-sp14]
MFKNIIFFAFLGLILGGTAFTIADQALAHETSTCGKNITLASKLTRDNTLHCSVKSVGYFTGSVKYRIEFPEQQ